MTLPILYSNTWKESHPRDTIYLCEMTGRAIDYVEAQKRVHRASDGNAQGESDPVFHRYSSSSNTKTLSEQVLDKIEATAKAALGMDGLIDFMGEVTAIHHVQDYIFQVERSKTHFRVSVGHIDSELGQEILARESALMKTNFAVVARNGLRSEANKGPKGSLRAPSHDQLAAAATNGPGENFLTKGTEQPSSPYQPLVERIDAQLLTGNRS